MYISSRYVGSLLAISVILASAATAQRTIYVSLDGGNNSPYTNGWASAATDIQLAVDEAIANDTVLVSNGTYNLVRVNDAATHPLYINKAIIFRSLNGPTNTFINGPLPNVAKGCMVVSAAAYIDGFTITNGYTWRAECMAGGVYLDASAIGAVMTNCVIAASGGESGYAGNIYMLAGTVVNCIVSNSLERGGIRASGNAIVSNCTIQGNVNANVGGGVSMSEQASVINCTIQGNTTADYGGGVTMSQWASVINCRIIGNLAGALNGGGAGINTSGGIVSNCVIMNNYTTNSGSRGGGIYMGPANGAPPTLIYNCLIASNSVVSTGGGIQLYDGWYSTNSSIANCTIVNNKAATGGGLYLHVGSSNNGLFNLIVVSNTATTGPNIYNLVAGWPADQVNLVNSCTPDVFSGSGNITDDPKFADYANANYQLAKGSPCINTGMNQEWMTGAVDLDGHSRKDQFSGMVDMGCYEYLPRGAMFSFH